MTREEARIQKIVVCSMSVVCYVVLAYLTLYGG
jgi:hypothetical protein